MTKEQNICYCGNYGGGMHTRSARCPGGELRTPQGEPALTSQRELPGTREPVVTAPQGNAGESPASTSSKTVTELCRFCDLPIAPGERRPIVIGGYGHQYEAWCIRALRREIERLRPMAESWESYEAAQDRKSSAVETAGERMPKDYAIEHGLYLAKSAEDFLTVLNEVAMTESALETWDEDDAEYAPAKERVDRAWERRHDHWVSLQNSIFEFRKRAERAKGSAVEPAEEHLHWCAIRIGKHCNCHAEGTIQRLSENGSAEQT